MKVLYFHQHFSTPDGAGGTRSYEFAKRLVGNGHEVIMVCGSVDIGSTGLDDTFKSGKRRGWVDGIDVIEFELPYGNEQNLIRRSLVFFRYALRGILVALTEKYDVIFATSTPLTAAIPGIVGKWFKRKAFVFEVRDSWPELPIAMGIVTNPFVILTLKILERCAYSSANHLIGLAPGIIRQANDKGVPKDKCTLIPNGCDEEFKGPPRALSNKFIRMVYAGAHGRANGLYQILDVAIELKARRCDQIQIMMVGEGSEKASLKARAERGGLENIEFLPAMPKRELITFLQSCHFGIMCLDNVPSFYNGTSPNKFFDYIASGLPIATNYPGWVADLVKKHQCGFVTSPGKAGQFVDYILEFLDNPKKIREMSLEATRLSNQFRRNDLALRFEEILIQVTR